MQQDKYEYRVRGWAQLYTAGGCLTFAGLLVFMALSQQESFFGMEQPQTIINLEYWGSAILCSLLCGYVLYRGALQKKGTRQIVFGKKSLSLPKTVLSKTFISIDYNSIHSVKMHTPTRSPIKIITIKHGKTQTEISATGFASHSTFTTIYAQLKTKKAPASIKDTGAF